MTSWVLDRIRQHRSALEVIREERADAWSGNDLPDLATLAPGPAGASENALALLRARHPSIKEDYLAFLAEGASFPLYGLGSDDSLRVLAPEAIEALASRAPGILANWNSGPGAGTTTPAWQPVHRQDPNTFDARELASALVLVAGDERCDPALLWLPAPRSEYWLLASWEGCLRFASIRQAFDHLLTQAEQGIRASLA
jgi:hypothetical protein